MIGYGYELGDNLMINDLDIVQWGYLLSPEFELINSAGKPLTGGYIEVYIHGTRNKYYCASDFNGTLHPFQIPLDSLGSNIVLASPAHAYDVYVYNKYGSLIMSRYNVLPQVQGTAVVSGEVNITSNDNTVTITQVGDNNFDLSVADTVSSITDMVTDVVSAVSSNLMNEIIETAQEVSGLIPDVSNFTTHTEVNEAIVTAIDLVTSIIPTEQVQSDWNQNNPAEPDYIKNKPDLSNLVTENELATAITTVTGMIPSTSTFATHTEVYDSTVTAINLVTSIIPEAQVQSNWTETDTSDPSYIQNKPEEYTVIAGQNIGIFIDGNNFTIAASGTDLTNYATHTEVNNVSGQIISTMNDVSGTIVEMIPSAQVQSDWNQSDNTQPDYIKNKPNLSNFVTDQEFIEVVSGVTGVGDYGQFYSTAVSGGAIMFRTKGTIDVTNDGKIKLKKGNSYHVTVRGRYNATTLTNVYGDISYIEYITFNPIHINVDKTVSESQYFEISYDLYQLNSDSDYYVFFSGLDGTINDLYIEIHAIGHVGAGGTVTGSPEYDAGWGIQILNNVISVNPSIIPDDINLVAGNNIGITVSGSDLVISASGSDLSDYATLEQLQDSVELVTGLIPTVQLNDSDQVTAINNYPIYSQGGGTQYSAGDGIDITNNVISVDNTVALKSDIPDVSNYATHTEVNNVSGAIVALIPELPEDINLVAGQNIGITVSGNDVIIAASGSPQVQSNWTEDDTSDPSYIQNKPDLSNYVTENELVTAVTAVSGMIPPAQVQSNWTETNTSSKAYIQNKPLEYSVVAGQNIGIAVDGTNLVISASGSDLANYATHAEVNNVSGYLQNEIDNIPAQEQADWSQTDNTQVDYIKNKPNETTLCAGDNISITVTGVSAVISSTGGGGGSTYTAGDHIGIENNEISVTGITELVAGNAITITTSGASAIISSTGEAQVQANWNETNPSSKAYIQNKPTIPDAQVQSNWNETNTSSKAYIQNKPTIHNYSGASGINITNDTITLDNPIGLVAGENIAIEVSGVSAIISATGGGSSYSAGNGIDITNNVISIDNTVALKTDIPDVSNFATETEVNTVSGVLEGHIQTVSAAIPAAQIQSDWTQSDNTQVDYIKNKPYEKVLVAGDNIGIIVSGASVVLCASATDLTDYATHTEVNNVSGAIVSLIPDVSNLATKTEVITQVQAATAMIPDISDLATKDELQDGLELVTGMIPDAQVQSDWTQSDNTQVDYIKNKPTETTLYAGENITLTVTGVSAIVSCDIDTSELATKDELVTAVTAVSGMIPTSINPLITANIEDIEVVTAVPSSAVSSVLYLIPEE